MMDKRSRYLMSIFSILQSLLAFVDLLGVAIIGAVGSLSIRLLRNEPPGERVQQVSAILNLDTFSTKVQIAYFAGMAISIFVAKSIFMFWFSRLSFKFLSLEGAKLSDRYLQKALTQNLDELEGRSIQANVHASTYGIQNIMTGVLGPYYMLAPDVILLFILYFGLFALTSSTAFISLILFASSLFLLNTFYKNRNLTLGNKVGELVIRNSELVADIFHSFREIYTRGTSELYLRKVSKIRKEIAILQARLKTIPYVTRLMMENVLFIGVGITAFLEIGRTSIIQASANLTLFLATSSRIMPAFLRINQNISLIRSNVGSSRMTYEILDQIDKKPRKLSVKNELSPKSQIERFNSGIEFNKVNYGFTTTKDLLFSKFDLVIPPREYLAIVGPSGGGKTTLVDLMLGLRVPQAGSVTISNTSPQNVIKKWPGKVAYVPQQVFISNSTLLDNLLLGLSDKIIDNDLLHQIFLECGLDELEKDFHKCLTLKIGEKGIRLSGGQRQRVGIARALITNPEILILDEATSSLDPLSESKIKSLLEERVQITRIVVAHRLTSIQTANRILYLEKGGVTGEGTFQELFQLHKEFRNQVNSLQFEERQ